MKNTITNKTNWWTTILPSILSAIMVGVFTLVGIRLTYQKEMQARIDIERKYEAYTQILTAIYTIAVALPKEDSDYDKYKKEQEEYLGKHLTVSKMNDILILISLYASDDVCQMMSKMYEDKKVSHEELLSLSLQMRKEIFRGKTSLKITDLPKPFVFFSSDID